MKLVHSGDFHLNKSFAELTSSVAAMRRAEQLETVEKICSLAADADVLLLAGDLLDTNEFDKNSFDNLNHFFKNIPNTKILIVLGNHDPYGLQSPFLIYEFSENVHIFQNQLEKVSFDTFDVYGVSYCEHMPRLSEIRIENPEKINILLVHGELNGADYNPILENEMKESGFDYIALGHVHTFSKVLQAGSTYYAYPGIPEPTGFDEIGEKGVIVGTLEKNLCGLEFIKTCRRQYHVISVSLHCPNSYDEILNQMMEQIGNKDDLYKVILNGKVDMDFIINTDILQEKLQEKVYFCKIKNKTELYVPYEKIAEEYSLRGIFVKNILEQIKKEPNRQVQLKSALQMGLSAMEGKSL